MIKMIIMPNKKLKKISQDKVLLSKNKITLLIIAKIFLKIVEEIQALFMEIANLFSNKIIIIPKIAILYQIF